MVLKERLFHLLKEKCVQSVGGEPGKGKFKNSLHKAPPIVRFGELELPDGEIRKELFDPVVGLKIFEKQLRVVEWFEMCNLGGNKDILLIESQMVRRCKVVEAKVLFPIQEKDLFEEDEQRPGNPEPVRLGHNKEVNVAFVICRILGKVAGHEYSPDKRKSFDDVHGDAGPLPETFRVAFLCTALRNDGGTLPTDKIVIVFDEDVMARPVAVNVVQKLFERQGVDRKKRKDFFCRQRIVPDVVIE